MISYSQFLKAKKIGVIEVLLLCIDFALVACFLKTNSVNNLICFEVYCLILVIGVFIVPHKKYCQLLQNGMIVHGKVLSSKRTLLSYKGMINNRIRIEIFLDRRYVIKSEYKMFASVYKRHSAVGQDVNVLIDPSDIKNHYVFHEELFDNEGFR